MIQKDVRLKEKRGVKLILMVFVISSDWKQYEPIRKEGYVDGGTMFRGVKKERVV